MALVVGLLGAAVVLVPAIVNVGDVFSENPFAEGRSVERTVRETSGQTITETKTKSDDLSALDRLLPSGAILLLQLAIAALASFAAGAITQRIAAADFSGEFGPFKLEKITRAARASSASLEETARRMEAQMMVTRQAVKVASEANRRVKELEARLGRLEAPERPDPPRAPRRSTGSAPKT